MTVDGGSVRRSPRRRRGLAPVIAIAAGDPCGIGPEIILKALRGIGKTVSARLIVIGDQAVFERTARLLHQTLPEWRSLHLEDSAPSPIGRLSFVDCAHPYRFLPGRSCRDAGAASLAYVDAAIALWRAGRIDALVTAPVTKWAIARRRFGFVGQTEYLAQALHRRHVVMMFVSDALRVVLLSRHVALAHVSRLVSRAVVRKTLQITHGALQRQFGIRHPCLAVCGLNPHAGEDGLFGREELQVLLPVLRHVRRQGLRCDGPFAADGFFAQPCTYDAVVCWYHDQGLIPFKLMARDRGCQLSVGLPLCRTSPDHGSGLAIAGRGIAHPGSMIYAINLAARLANTRMYGSPSGWRNA